MTTPSSIAARVIAKSRHIGGNTQLVPISDFVLRNEFSALMASMAEALDALRAEAGMSTDKVLDVLQVNGFDDIAATYRTWVRSQHNVE